jgi:hypothetical protein
VLVVEFNEDEIKVMAERQITAAQKRFVSLTRGERVAGDDDAPAREEAARMLLAAAGRKMT